MGPVFAGGRRPHAPGWPHPDPDRFQIGSGGLATHPGLLLDATQWPSESSQGNHLFFFASLKTLLISTKAKYLAPNSTSQDLILAGRFSSDPHWPVSGDP